MNIRRLFALSASACICVSAVLVGDAPAAGDQVGRDGSWAEGRGVTFDRAGDADQGEAGAVQADGRVVVVGSSNNGEDSDAVIMRRMPDGSPDSSFGEGGLLVFDGGYSDFFFDVAVLPDGAIVAAGATVLGPTYNRLLVRLRSDGTLDDTFGDGGVVIGDQGEIKAVTPQPDGGLVAAGTTSTDYVRQGDVFLSRYTRSGDTDPSFGFGGTTVVDTGSSEAGTSWSESASSVAQLDDGTFVLGGSRAAGSSSSGLAMRFLPSGLLDRAFSGTGWRTFNFGNHTAVDVVPRSGGRAVLGLWVFSEDRFALVAVDPSGNLDSSFGSGGVTRYHGNLAALAQDVSGRLVTVSGIASFQVARFSTDGIWDYAGFGDVTENLFALNEFARDVFGQPDGKIVIVGFGYRSYDPAPSGGPAIDIGVARLAVVPEPPHPPATGYWMIGEDGSVYSFGDAHWHGNAPVGRRKAVEIESTPTGRGYWIIDEAGHVFGFGDAPYLGGAPPLRIFEIITSVAATPSGRGYWLFSSAGRVFTFGDAGFFGDMAATRLNGPVLDATPTPTGGGYYMVASDGGVFTFGDAIFAGSMGSIPLNAPVQSLVPDPDRSGYWLVASDGGIFTFNATFHGSMGDTRLNKPITGMIGYSNGYLMVAEDGGIFTFGDAQFYGSLGSQPPPRPITAVTPQR